MQTGEGGVTSWTDGGTGIGVATAVFDGQRDGGGREEVAAIETVGATLMRFTVTQLSVPAR